MVSQTREKSTSKVLNLKGGKWEAVAKQTVDVHQVKSTVKVHFFSPQPSIVDHHVSPLCLACWGHLPSFSCPRSFLLKLLY